MLPYRVFIFDFDGTLCATEEAILYTFQKMFEQAELTPPPAAKIRQGISTGGNLETMLPFLYTPLLEDPTGVLLREWVVNYRHLYQTEGGKLTTLFDGATELLSQIKGLGFTSVVLSNKGQQPIEAALQHFNLTPYFDLVIGDNPLLPLAKKPDPMAFHQVIQAKYAHVPADQFLMVGDTHADLHFARNADIASCWAAFGYGAPELCQAAAPTLTVHSLTELSLLLNPDG